MRGMTKDPMSGDMIPMINPVTSMATTFALSGDPASQAGWIDAASADRRLMLSSGPFDMAPGDTQEVVVAVVVGQGSNPINSITALKAASATVQTIYNLGFDIPSADQIASVYSRGLNGQVELFWSGESVGDVQYSSGLNEEYHFEGFNVYQGQTEVGPWEKIATYDVVNEVALIYADVVDPISGGTQRIIIQNGTNSGLQFQQLVSYDAFSDQPLVNGHTYHFGISGYHYDVNHMVEFLDLYGNFLGYLTPVIESPIVKIAEMPIANPSSVTDTADHIAGGSDGQVLIEWLDPSANTGHDYRVNFNAQNNWSLIDFSTGMTLLSNQQNQSGDFDYPIVDGFMIRVIGPGLGVKAVQEVANAYGPLGTPDNVNFSLNSTGDWYMDPQGTHALSRYSWLGATANDYEIRVTASANTHVLEFFGQGDYSFVLPYVTPVEIWDIGSGTPNDPSDDRQIPYMNLDDNGSGSLDWGDGLYLWDIDYDAVPWSQPGWHTGFLDPNSEGLHLGRIRFEDNSGYYPFVPTGTIVRISTNKPNSQSDIFAFSTGYDCGDIDQNKQVDITDYVFLINYIFASGMPPQDMDDADVDCNSKINITDCVYMINYIFAGGPLPCAACQSM